MREVKARPWRGPKGEACSFCSILTTNGVAHGHCPGVVGRWTCACHTAGHPKEGRTRPISRDTTDDVE